MKISVVPTVEKIVQKPFQFMANNKLMKSFCDKFELTPTKMLEYTTIGSLVGKDSIGCYMYVKQSLNNDKIPEEKRSFVAALDLTNGSLMILSQLLAFFTISNPKVQKKLFGKFFDKLFKNDSIKRIITSARNSAKVQNYGVELTKDAASKEIAKVKKTAEDMFRVISSLIASTTIAKRIVVPFLATPLAGWAQDKFIDKKKPSDAKNGDTLVKEADTKSKNIEVSTTSTEKPKQEFKCNLLNKYKN